MTVWKAHADALDDGDLPAEHDNQVHLARTLDGSGELHASLDADHTAIVEAALRVADPKDFDQPLAVRRAEALDVVCRFFLDHQRTRLGGRHRPHLNVLVDRRRTPPTSTPASPSQRPSSPSCECDSVLHRLLVDSRSAILDYGRAVRVPPVDLYNAVVARDQHCRWPGCDRPASWCDAHHIDEWSHGGATRLADLVLLCRRHHRILHKPGWHAKLLPDATFEITHPDGRTETSEPPLATRQRRRRTGDG